MLQFWYKALWQSSWLAIHGEKIGDLFKDRRLQVYVYIHVQSWIGPDYLEPQQLSGKKNHQGTQRPNHSKHDKNV